MIATYSHWRVQYPFRFCCDFNRSAGSNALPRILHCETSSEYIQWCKDSIPPRSMACVGDGGRAIFVCIILNIGRTVRWQKIT